MGEGMGRKEVAPMADGVMIRSPKWLQQYTNTMMQPEHYVIVLRIYFRDKADLYGKYYDQPE